MRAEIMESTEDDFVRSLSHCVNWQARGGKSGAVFYATEGDWQHQSHILFLTSIYQEVPFEVKRRLLNMSVVPHCFFTLPQMTDTF